MRHWLALIIVFSLPITLSAQGHRGKGEPRLDKSLLELPAIRKSDVVLVYNGFVVNYNTKRLIPNWVAYELTAMNESFYLTNICPQNHELNGRDWQTLEKYVRDWAVKYGKVWIVCGPYVKDNREEWKR